MEEKTKKELRIRMNQIEQFVRCPNEMFDRFNDVLDVYDKAVWFCVLRKTLGYTDSKTGKPKEWAEISGSIFAEDGPMGETRAMKSVSNLEKLGCIFVRRLKKQNGSPYNVYKFNMDVELPEIKKEKLKAKPYKKNKFKRKFISTPTRSKHTPYPPNTETKRNYLNTNKRNLIKEIYKKIFPKLINARQRINPLPPRSSEEQLIHSFGADNTIKVSSNPSALPRDTKEENQVALESDFNKLPDFGVREFTTILLAHEIHAVVPEKNYDDISLKEQKKLIIPVQLTPKEIFELTKKEMAQKRIVTGKFEA